MKSPLILYLKKIKIFFLYFYQEHLISSKRKIKFKNDFKILYKKIKKKQNFAFSRFSDGELFVIQNKKLIIANNYWLVDDKKTYAKFHKNDQKKFLPSKHKFYRKKLIDSLTFEKKNYFKGVSCLCCNGRNSVNYMKSFVKSKKNLTFSNLLQNNNYPLFIKKMIKIFSKKKIILVANKNHNHLKLPFLIEKKFNIGKNCLINDFNIIRKIKKFIIKNNIKNHIFLISASSLSNILIMELFKEFDKNTYIDIGSTLNPYYNMNLLSNSRSYLSEYWLNDKASKHLKKACYW